MFRQHLSHKPATLRRKPARPQPDEQTDTLINMQSTIGNAATQRLLSTDSSSIVGSQALLGNARVQRLLHPAPAGNIQRRLNFTPGALTGKKSKSALTKLIDNSHTSTFRAVEDALENYQKTASEDALNLKKWLTIIVEKSDAWLGDHTHLAMKDDQKRNSLQKLRDEAWIERRRVIITLEIGVPYQIVDTFNPQQVEDFWKIIEALNAKKPDMALKEFDTYQGYLGDAAILVRQFMIRNQIQTMNPQLAASMNTPGFKMDPKKGGGAKQLIIDEARAKLAEHDRLKAKYDAQYAEYMEEVKKNPNKKMTDYEMLAGMSGEGMAFGKLKIQKAQFEGIVNGTTIPQKQQVKGLENLTEAELYGIVGYTSELFGTINSGLRNNAADKGKFTGAHVELAESITSGLSKLKPYSGRVFRHNGDFPAFKLVNIQDATVVEIAPTSTAVSQAACASAGQNHGVLEVFTSINGKDVSKASVFGAGEQEILFAPGTRFRVTGAFARERRFWGKPHHEDQYKINGQQAHPLFGEAMKLVEADFKKNDFHRVIFKDEVK